jgi:hypothetical protein
MPSRKQVFAVWCVTSDSLQQANAFPELGGIACIRTSIIAGTVDTLASHMQCPARSMVITL